MTDLICAFLIVCGCALAAGSALCVFSAGIGMFKEAMDEWRR